MGFFVEIRCTDHELTEAMKQMRSWLDEKRYEPKRFNYSQSIDGLVIHVEFALEHYASDFCQAFNGKIAAGSTE